MTEKLTPAQQKWLLRLTVGIVVRPYADNFRAWDRVMEALQQKGLATPYVHGGFEITAAGKVLASTLEKR